MYVGRDFDTVQDNSAQVFGFDLAPTLTSGETITAASAGLILENGVDDLPMSHLVGSFQLVGTKITQMVWWNDPLGKLTGNTYVFFVVTRTSIGEIIVPWARITIDKGYGKPAGAAGGALPQAQVYVIPVPKPAFILPTDGGYALRDLPEIDQGEQRFFGFDLSPLLSPNETLTSASAALTTISGRDVTIDQDPTAYFVGSPQPSGSVVQQLTGLPPPAALLERPPLVPDLRGVTYALSLNIRTSFGQSIGTWSRLRVRAFYA